MAQSTKSLLFGGVDGLVSSGNTAVLASATAFSASFWVKPDTSQGSLPRLFQINDADKFYFLLLGTATDIRFSINGATIDGTITASVWNHVAGTWNGSTFKLFVGGTQVNSGSVSGSFDPTGVNLSLGNRFLTDRPFKGGLDDIFMWASDIGATNVANIASGATDAATLSPVFSWRLEAGSGTSAADGVGSNTGTLSGGVTWSSDVPAALGGGGGGSAVGADAMHYYLRHVAGAGH
jgi:hypothetical protein